MFCAAGLGESAAWVSKLTVRGIPVQTAVKVRLLLGITKESCLLVELFNPAGTVPPAGAVTVQRVKLKPSLVPASTCICEPCSPKTLYWFVALWNSPEAGGLVLDSTTPEPSVTPSPALAINAWRMILKWVLPVPVPAPPAVTPIVFISQLFIACTGAATLVVMLV